jgi:hypothetical protein
MTSEVDNIQKRYAFLISIGMLVLFAFVCVPWIESQIIPEEMQQLIEQKDISPANLFYTESPLSSEAIYRLESKLDSATQLEK